jgi:beta-lactamase regulating signal transducer with metallopeptidase domain
MNIQHFIQSGEAVAGWVFQTSLHASVLIGLVFLIQRMFGKFLSPRWRYALSLLVLLRLVLPAVPSSQFSVFNLGASRFQLASQTATIPRATLPDLALVIEPTVLESARPVTSFALETKPIVETNGFGVLNALELVWLIGLCALLLCTIRRHREFSRWVKSQKTAADAGILSLVEDGKAVMGVTKPIRTICVSNLGTPAVFGWWKPCLLLPERMIASLSQEELRLVILHELAHVKRHDILLNWIIIVVRSLHWFNPLVWLAMRRLRSERELVCDEMVMTHLGTEERRLYGNTLIKLVKDFSKIRFCPSLVPAINSKSEIKRRVRMIAQFRPATRAAVIGSAALVLAVCCFTFTRAADKKETEVESDAARRAEVSKRNSPVLEQLAKQREELTRAQERMDKLRKELGVSDSDLDPYSPPSIHPPETVRYLERDRIQAQSMFVMYDAILKELKGKSKAELRKAIPTASPDTHLSELLSKYYQAQNQFATMVNSFGKENPQLVDLNSLMTNLDAQIEERVEGVLSGLGAQAASQKARAQHLEQEVERARKREAEKMEKYRPFFEAKREMETRQRIYENLTLRIRSEAIDSSLPGIASQPSNQTLTEQIEDLRRQLNGLLAEKAALARKRNVKLPVPLTLELIHYAPADRAKGEETDKFGILDVNGETRRVAQSDKIVVNIFGAPQRFALARISLLSDKENFIQLLNEKRERLIETASGVLAAKTLDDLNKAGFRTILKSELQTLFNQILGEAVVQEVLLHEFVQQ